MNRREFMGAAAGAIISPIAAQSSRISDIQHIRLHGNRVTYCGHPRQGGLFYFGGGELVSCIITRPCTTRVARMCSTIFTGTMHAPCFCCRGRWIAA
jgi:hypothetical protein